MAFAGPDKKRGLFTANNIATLYRFGSTLGRMGYRYAVRGGKRQRLSRARSRTRTRVKARSKYTSGRGITTQHDQRRIYVKRRMPYKKRKRWSAFIRKVNAVDERELGSRTVVFNHTVKTAAITDGQQITLSAALYPVKSTSAYLEDLSKISSIENYGNPTAAAGDTVDGTTKLMFQSGILDLTVRNTSNDGGTPISTLIDCPLEVDVYEITVGAGESDSGGTYDRLIGYFNQASNLTKDIGGVGGSSILDMSDRGVTPWDLPTALSKFRIKIWKKTKYFISSNQTFTYQVRDAKRHVTTFNKIGTITSVNMNGWTKFVFFIAKPIPGIVVQTGVVPELTIGITRKYLYKVEGIRDNRDYYQKA